MSGLIRRNVKGAPLRPTSASPAAIAGRPVLVARPEASTESVPADTRVGREALACGITPVATSSGLDTGESSVVSSVLHVRNGG